ncbi:hypothetical protein, partial [Paenibacillus xylanexedens]|uniref:hypothetical protein n=1 Tax=Paenibacillus xylanexedens TaxID=528191 RepID=UPI001C92CC57
MGKRLRGEEKGDDGYKDNWGWSDGLCGLCGGEGREILRWVSWITEEWRRLIREEVEIWGWV